MRGAPLTELLVLLLLGALLTAPVVRLTRPPPTPPAPPPTAGQHADVETWIDLRFSHPPSRFHLRQGDRVLLEGAGELRAEVDAPVALDGDRLALRLEVDWPPEVAQAYVEVAMEPQGRDARRDGSWGRGHMDILLEGSW